jgi:hypothetical protein
MSKAAPRIESASWGKIRIEGYPNPFKDAKLYPGGAREWDWNETGTRHDPGIQGEDVKELLERGAEKLILSQGYWKRLKIPERTLDLLRQRSIDFEILPTGKAVKVYNEALQEDQETIGALIHSTC